MTDGFDLRSALRDGAVRGLDGTRASVAPGTNLLVAGPPMTGKDRLARELLSAGFGADDAAVVVTTTRGAADVVERLTRRVDAGPGRVRGVDCMSVHPGPDERAAVTGVASPRDLTGIGMRVDRHLERIDDGGLRPRLGLLSVSTLLLYADVRPVFRFLHVLTNRVREVGGLGVFLLDTDTQDSRVESVLTTLFDGRVPATGADAGGESNGEGEGEREGNGEAAPRTDHAGDPGS